MWNSTNYNFGKNNDSENVRNAFYNLKPMFFRNVKFITLLLFINKIYWVEWKMAIVRFSVSFFGFFTKNTFLRKTQVHFKEGTQALYSLLGERLTPIRSLWDDQNLKDDFSSMLNNSVKKLYSNLLIRKFKTICSFKIYKCYLPRIFHLYSVTQQIR